MKITKSIMFRIASSIVIFGLLLTILQLIISFFVIRNLHNGFIYDILNTEVDSYLYQYEHDRDTAVPHSKYIRTFKSLSEIPEPLQDIVGKLDIGIYSPEDLNSVRPVNIAVVQLPDSDTPFYMFFDGKTLRNDHQNFINPKYALGIVFLVLLIPGSLLGIYVAKRIMQPLKNLVIKIEALDPNKLSDDFSDAHSYNEIGVLTKTLEQTMSRIKQFIIREKEFTLDASHELRTPLNIVKGAVEIIDAQPDTDKNDLTKRALGRIKRSVKEMETTIDTFLYLARENTDKKEICNISVAIDSALDQNKHLLEGKEIEIERHLTSVPVVYAPQMVMFIVLNNIIRNAYSFTYEGSVSITVNQDYIEIADTGVGIEADKIQNVIKPPIKGSESQGFGDGFIIVERLCGRFNLKLHIESMKFKGTKVRLYFNN